MDAITHAAITGTSREAAPARDLTTDDLLGSVQDRSPERDLLLRAGMYAVYRDAGRKAETGIRSPKPAQEETFPACSTRAAEVVKQLLASRRDDILREALERLRLAGLRLPHALLPLALDVQQRELRAAVIAVLGERGRWLARFNPAWRWVDLQADAGTAEVDEATWEEGSLSQRLDALSRVRGLDPAQGLRWVDEVWKTEKADARAGMVAALETGISSGDEPLLERALDDRSVRVREAAAGLLARIPGSAYAGRAIARADTVLAGYAPPTSGLLRGRRVGRFILETPENVDGGWMRDLPGVDKAPQGMWKKAWRITRAIAAVPPAHWEERFSVGPFELVSAARGDWETALLTGWCRATSAHQTGSWALPLWEHCYNSPHSSEGEMVWDAALPLAGLLSSADLAEAFPRLVGNGVMPSRLANTLRSLPGPWDEPFSDVYLAALQKMYVNASSADSAASSWPDTLQAGAGRLSVSCLARFEARMPVFTEEENGPYEYRKRHWRQELEKFGETLDLRRKLVEEMPL